MEVMLVMLLFSLVARYGEEVEGHKKGGSLDHEVALRPSGVSMLFHRALAISPCSFWLGWRQSGAKNE